jgi:Ser/Thr protein kinase RdoA (MazF antagonist)
MSTVSTGQVSVLALRAVAEFGLAPDSRITFVKHRENHVFRVANDDGEWALKLHRPGYRSDGEIESEAAVCELMASAGVRVPLPLRTIGGSHIAHIDCGGHTHQATMQVWARNARPIGDSADVFLGGPRPTDATLQDLGRTIAVMHRCTELNGPPEDYDRPAWDADGLAGGAPLWGRASELPALNDQSRSVIRAAEQRLHRELRDLERTRKTYGPIHGDLTMENVLRDDDGLTVIDFDDMGEGWYVFDLATAFIFLTNHSEADAMITQLAGGYAVERSITTEDARAWHPLLLARALTYLGWSVTRPDEEATAFHIRELLPHFTAAAHRYLESGHTGWPDLPTS